MVNLTDLLSSIYEQSLVIYSNLSETTFLGNSIWSYILIPVIFVAMNLLLYGIKFSILTRLSKKLKQLDESSKLIGISNLINEAKKIITWPLIITISFYVSILHINFASTLKLLIDIFIFGIFIFFIYRSLSNIINISTSYYESREGKKVNHITSFIRIISKTVIIVILLSWYLTLIGVNISAVVASIGIAGIAIAFALQNVLEDLFATIVIYFDKPFELGDNIQVGDDLGTVEQIGIRSTHLRSVDGELIVLSNQELTTKKIVNYKKMDTRRETQILGVGAETPVKVLRKIPDMITDIIENTELVKPDRVKLVELGDFSWNFEIVYHVNSPEVAIFRDKQHEINLAILEKFEQEGIEIPYPIQEIRLGNRELIQRVKQLV